MAQIEKVYVLYAISLVFEAVMGNWSLKLHRQFFAKLAFVISVQLVKANLETMREADLL